MSQPFLKSLQDCLPGVEWIDSTDVMKQVRKIKSPRSWSRSMWRCSGKSIGRRFRISSRIARGQIGEDDALFYLRRIFCYNAVELFGL